LVASPSFGGRAAGHTTVKWSIRGCKVLDIEREKSQYADDTAIILEGSPHTFSRSLFLLDTLAIVLRLRVNNSKTEAF